MTKGLHWKGDSVRERVTKALTEAYIDWHLIAEQSIKAELYPKHGYDTGTLNRSIHAESATYIWAEDHVPRTRSSPERGGQRFKPTITRHKIMGGIGSGQKYAIYVHQGTKKRVGLYYIYEGIKQVEHRWAEVLDYRARQYSDRH